MATTSTSFDRRELRDVEPALEPGADDGDVHGVPRPRHPGPRSRWPLSSLALTRSHRWTPGLNVHGVPRPRHSGPRSSWPLVRWRSLARTSGQPRAERSRRSPATPPWPAQSLAARSLALTRSHQWTTPAGSWRSPATQAAVGRSFVGTHSLAPVEPRVQRSRLSRRAARPSGSAGRRQRISEAATTEVPAAEVWDDEQRAVLTGEHDVASARRAHVHAGRQATTDSPSSARQR